MSFFKWMGGLVIMTAIGFACKSRQNTSDPKEVEIHAGSEMDEMVLTTTLTYQKLDDMVIDWVKPLEEIANTGESLFFQMLAINVRLKDNLYVKSEYYSHQHGDILGNTMKSVGDLGIFLKNYAKSGDTYQTVYGYIPRKTPMFEKGQKVQSVTFCDGKKGFDPSWLPTGHTDHLRIVKIKALYPNESIPKDGNPLDLSGCRLKEKGDTFKPIKRPQ